MIAKLFQVTLIPSSGSLCVNEVQLKLAVLETDRVFPLRRVQYSAIDQLSALLRQFSLLSDSAVGVSLKGTALTIDWASTA